jgi:hypothetical protein
MLSASPNGVRANNEPQSPLFNCSNEVIAFPLHDLARHCMKKVNREKQAKQRRPWELLHLPA